MAAGLGGAPGRHGVRLGEQPMDVAFHPFGPVAAAGLVDGSAEVCAWEPAERSAAATARFACHPASCRAVRFSPDGGTLLTAAADGAWGATDVDSGALAHLERPAGAAEGGGAGPPAPAINRLETVGADCLAAGDDDGAVALWDRRQRRAVCTYGPHTDFIADLAWAERDRTLLAASGDGTLSVFDLRRQRCVALSEDDTDDEFLAVAVVKGGKKVVCGSGGGVLNLFSWGYWNDCSDRFPGHPEAVEAVVKLDEDTVATGSADGVLRVVSILPNRLVGVVGAHMDCPVERLAHFAGPGGGGGLLASASHDSVLKFWPLDEDSAESEEEDEEGDGEAAGRRKRRWQAGAKSTDVAVRGRQEFFADL